jgi:ABC-type phosphate transport system substrate-binding protein
VKITGVRFAYPLVQKWIDSFNKEYPDVQIIIEPRGSADPSSDILLEAYEQPEEIKNSREYVYIARYAILPVANSRSDFAKTYTEKGLNKDLIVQLFFHDIYADKENQKEIKEPVTIYTRLQKAGAPTTFAKHFGYQQKDIKGKSIAGADEHLLKALLRDSTGISYLPLSLIYDRSTKKTVGGIKVIPVDLNGNGKVNDDEKFYDDELSAVTQRFEDASAGDLNNVPVEYLHFSVDKKGVSPEALTFLTWVIRNGEKDLHDFGYLNPEPGKLERDKFEQFASKRIK